MELGAGAGKLAIEERKAPRTLFVGIPTSGNTSLYTYTAADDGQRFLVSSSKSSSRPAITLEVNWQSALARRAGGS